MNFKKLTIVLFLIFSILPTTKILAQSSDIGFVSENIWYSEDSFEEGDKIRIYTFIFNPDSRELSGTVLFFDKTVLLGKKDFAVPPKRALDVSIDWTVVAGDHTIFGKIEDAKFLVSTGNYEQASISENETRKNSYTVSKKIISEKKYLTSDFTTASSVKDIIEAKTPKFITKSIISITNQLEEIRDEINIATKFKKEKIKNEITQLENDKKISTEKTAPNPFLKPFKYVEMFFLSVSLLIINNKIIFYGLLALVVFFILRFILNRIF